MAAYLTDTSIWAWAKTAPPIQGKLAERLGRGEVTTCVPVALEVLHSAHSSSDYEQRLERLQRLRWLALPPEAADRALEMQRGLAQTTHGAHRLPAVDYLVAAVAERWGATLWHLDRDLARLCDFTGQLQEHERPPRRPRA